MKALVCGGRDYSNFQHLKATLNKIHQETPITTLIHGAARGADSLAGRWAKETSVPVQEFPANWNAHDQKCGNRCRSGRYCRRAGFRRNEQMLEKGQPDTIIAFPGGRGTAGMVDLANSAGVKVLQG